MAEAMRNLPILTPDELTARLDELYRAIEEFNDGYFFESHETLEDLRLTARVASRMIIAARWRAGERQREEAHMNTNGRGTRPSIVITGASTGIGEASALRLASIGFRVFAGVRKQADADALLQK